MLKILIHNKRESIPHFIAAKLEKLSQAPTSMKVVRVNDDTLLFEIEGEPGGAQFDVIELMVSRALLDFDEGVAQKERDRVEVETRKADEAKTAAKEAKAATDAKAKEERDRATRDKEASFRADAPAARRPIDSSLITGRREDAARQADARASVEDGGYANAEIKQDAPNRPARENVAREAGASAQDDAKAAAQRDNIRAAEEDRVTTSRDVLGPAPDHRPM